MNLPNPMYAMNYANSFSPMNAAHKHLPVELWMLLTAGAMALVLAGLLLSSWPKDDGNLPD